MIYSSALQEVKIQQVKVVVIKKKKKEKNSRTLFNPELRLIWPSKANRFDIRKNIPLSCYNFHP